MKLFRGFCLLIILCFFTPPTHAADDLSGWKFIDLSHTFKDGMAVWPGAPAFTLETVGTIEKAGYYINKYCTGEHIGTHVDAPSHFDPKGKNVDEIPLENLLGPLVVLDLTEKAKADPDLAIGKQDILDWEAAHGRIPDGAFVVADTGWWKKWETPKDYVNADDKGVLHFPGFSEKAIQFLLAERNIKGVGIDTLSTDPGTSETFAEHNLLLGKGMVNIENLTNLDQVPTTGATLVVGAVKIAKGSGAPARVFALVKQ